jgi:transcriptional regulator with XRE-family HTH domain
MKHYLERAKLETRARSWSELARLADISQTAIAKLVGGKTLPSEETMVKLARLGRMDPTLALIDLRVWTAPRSCKPLYAALQADLEHKIKAASGPKWKREGDRAA